MIRDYLNGKKEGDRLWTFEREKEMREWEEWRRKEKRGRVSIKSRERTEAIQRE